MNQPAFNKYRAAIEVLQKGRDLLVDAIADEVLDQGTDLIDTSYQFHEFLESQGTRLHFLMLLLSQLEQSADALDETLAVSPPPPPPPTKAPSKRRTRARSRTRRPRQEVSTEGSPDDA